MPTFQPFQNGISSMRRELASARADAAPVEEKSFLRAGEHLGILPPNMVRAPRSRIAVEPIQSTALTTGAPKAAGEASFPFKGEATAPGPSGPSHGYCPPSRQFSIQNIAELVRRTLPFTRENEGAPSGGGVISGALDDPGANGLVARVAYNDTVARTITMSPASNAALTVTDGDGVSGDPLLTVDNTLIALAGLSSTAGIVAQTAADTFTKRTLTPVPGEGVGIGDPDGAAGAPTFKVDRANTDSATVASGDEMLVYDADDTKVKRAALSGLLSAISGQPLDADLTAIAGLSATGLIARTGAGTASARSVAVNGAGNKAGLTAANGDGVSGNPTLGLDITGLATDGLDRIAVGDEIPFYNVSAGANHKTTLQLLLDKGLAGLTQTAFDDISADFVAYVDAASAKRASLQQLYDAINLLTAETTPATGDKLAMYDASAGACDSITLENLFKVIGSLTQKTSVTDGYKFAVVDESGNPGYATFEDLDPTGVHLICRTVAYTGNGVSGKTVTLTGINRVYQIQIMRYDTTGTNSPVFSTPEGATGAITWRSGDGGSGTSLSLDAPSAGTAQVLTINSTASGLNANGVSYKIAVWGTPT